MARPIKDGFDYFPKDTDFYNDDKVRLLRSEFGAKGMYLLDYILCEIYKKSGYFMKWDESRCALVSDGAGCGCSPTFVDEVIRGCVRCQFFDKTVFEAYSVLTSAGIQRRYIRMVSNRDYISFIEEYFLLDVNEKKDIPGGILAKCTFKKANLKENPSFLKENPDFLKENSIKESKVKESKVNKSNNDCCAPQKMCTTVIGLPLNTGELYEVIETDVTSWQELYPSVDIMQELRKMRGWLDANPSRRKTKSGIKRFINAWLAKEQDKGGITRNDKYQGGSSNGSASGKYGTWL